MEIGGIGSIHGSYGMSLEVPRRAAAGAPEGTQLSTQAQQQVQKLRQIDQKVRAHEQAHLSAAAGLAIGGASFQYMRGPDGKQYAVAGEVRIDVSPAQSPEQTIDKARRIQAAALAPADPSPQDRAVAAAAAQMAAQARVEQSRQVEEDQLGSGGQAEDASNPLRDRALRAYADSGQSAGSFLDVFA